jgi:16S rRNA G1207 methylase RsmC
MSVIDKTPFSESSKSKLSALSNLKRLRTVIAANSAKKGCNALVKYSRYAQELQTLSIAINMLLHTASQINLPFNTTERIGIHHHHKITLFALPGIFRLRENAAKTRGDISRVERTQDIRESI